MLFKRHRSLKFESLEKRRMMAFAAEGSPVGIKGTGGDDIIHVERVSNGYYNDNLVLTMNDEQATYYMSGIDTIIILGLGGNDQITVDDNVHIKAYIDAGKGDDTVVTSDGDDIVLGGAGNDTIASNDGDDRV